MSTAKAGPLVQAADVLERALAGGTDNQEKSWLDGLRQALTQVDGLLFRTPTPSTKELLAPVEPGKRDLSPKLARQVEGLRSGLAQMSEQVNRLLVKLQGAPTDHAALQELRAAGERLVTELRALREAETDLVQETAMRDTGTGD